MSHRFVVALGLCSTFIACSGPATSEPCGGACSSAEYCCLTHCQALGTVCGATDGGAFDASHADAADVDAPTPPDAGGSDAGVDAAAANPCVLHGGATTVVSACEASDPALVAAGYPGPATRSCATATGSWCGAMGNCVEWLDPATLALHAVCASPGRVGTDVCDPTHDTYGCVGSVERVCVADTDGEPGDPPPGWWGASDCRARWSADATCMVFSDGVARCTSPTDVACDPTTAVDHCNARCMAAPGLPMGGVVRPVCAGDRPMCVQNASTLDRPACLPADAVPSTMTATAEPVALACVGTTAIHVEQYGYEYTSDCAPVLEIGTGGVATMVPTSCWAAPDGSTALCLTADDVTCTTATAPHTCVDDTHATYCSGWLRVTQTCAPPAGPCDPSSGTCLTAPPCHPGWPFTETCAGTSQKWTLGGCATGLATLAPCPMCTPTATGDGVTCGT